MRGRERRKNTSYWAGKARLFHWIAYHGCIIVQTNSGETLKTTKQIATVTLIVLLGAIAYGLFRTGNSLTAPPMHRGGQATPGSAIDQAPLYTAQRLAQMPTSTVELPLAQEALRLGDREMDLAFAAAVWEAQVHPALLSAEAKQSQAKLQNAEKTLDGDNALVAQLTAALTRVAGAKEGSLKNRLEQATVQVQLDQDEVDNAKQELLLAGGDTQGRIEQLGQQPPKGWLQLHAYVQYCTDCATGGAYSLS
jgi:hypothetical protein